MYYERADTTSMQYDNTKYRGNILGKTCMKYKNMNKAKESIENSSPLYQAYTPTVI